jgi:hypothetical protein
MGGCTLSLIVRVSVKTLSRKDPFACGTTLHPDHLELSPECLKA